MNRGIGRMKLKVNYRSLVVGVALGSLLTISFTSMFMEYTFKRYADMYEYEEDAPFEDNWKKIEDKRQLLYNFMDRHDIFGLRSKEGYEGVEFQSVINMFDDDYAAYYTKEQTEEFLKSRQENFVGIGITTTLNGTTNSLTIINVTENSPAWKAGVRTGDVVYKVNGIEVLKYNAVEFGELLTDMDSNPIIELEIRRLGEDYKFRIQKRNIDYDYVDYELIDEWLPYIKITSFSGDADGQVAKAIKTMDNEIKETNMLVLDLRNNGGGVIGQAEKIAGLFVGKNKLLATIKSKSGEESKYMTSANQLVQSEIELFILANGTTASASELLICALQDYGLDITIIGDTTFGKGIAQRFETFLDGSSVKYTRGFYYSPNGRNIHKKGIEPDIREVDKDKQLEIIKELAGGKK